MSVTRVFRRRAGLGVPGAPNEGTAYVDNPLLKVDAKDDAPLDAKQLFIERYPIIKKSLEAHTSQGVLILAFDRQKTAVGQAWVRASLDRTRTVMIGRHSMCGLPLPASEKELSLRHMVVMARAVSHTESRVRVIDLHTPTGFRDEAGRVLQAIATEGPCFLRVGGVVLVVLTTEESAVVPDDAEEAYAAIPERVFIDELQGTAGEPERMRAPIQHSATMVKSRLGPLEAIGRLKKDDEPPRGELVVKARGGALRLPVGGSVLERGLMVGRYARCDLGGTSDEDSRLSRVHLLLIEDGGQVLAIDAASSNGTFVDGKAITSVTLEDGTLLDLASELRLTWHDS